MSTANAGLVPGEQFFRASGFFEGMRLEAYIDPAGVATIGAGSIRNMDGSPVKLGDTISQAEAYDLAVRDAEDAAKAVRKIERPLTQNQFDALCLFTNNLGEGCLNDLKPLIEAGRWEDVAESMGAYVRAWGHREGRWYRQALLGLRIRRMAEGLILLGLDWPEAANAEHIGMPKRREWQPEGSCPDGSKGRFFDVILPGGTEFTTIHEMALATPLPKPDLVLTSKADPAVSLIPAGKAVQPGSPPNPSPAASASPTVAAEKSVVPAAAGSAAAKPTAPPPVPVGGVITTKQVTVPQAQAQVPAKPPIVLTPQPINPNALPTNADTTKNMADSTRMIGMVLVAIGSVIQVVTLRLGIGTAIGAVFFDLSRDPTVITLTVTGIVFALGWVTKRNGKKTFAKGADQAVGGLH